MAVVVLGVTGSIAAYKACDLASKLVKTGHAVHAVLTASAAKLIQPVTFQTLTGNPVVTGMFHEYAGGPMPCFPKSSENPLKQSGTARPHTSCLPWSKPYYRRTGT